MKFIFRRRRLLKRSGAIITLTAGNSGPSEEGVVAELLKNIAILHDAGYVGELAQLAKLAQQDVSRASGYKIFLDFKKNPLYPYVSSRTFNELQEAVALVGPRPLPDDKAVLI